MEALQNQPAVARTDMTILEYNLTAATTEISTKELAIREEITRQQATAIAAIKKQDEMVKLMGQTAIKQKAAVDAAWHRGELAGKGVTFGDERTLMRLYNESKVLIQEQAIDKNNRAFVELGKWLAMTHLEIFASKLLHLE